MSQTVSQSTQSGDKRQAIAKLAAAPDEVKRRVCEDDFRIFANLVTYNWLDPKPEEWYPVPDHALDWHRHLHGGDYTPMVLCQRKGTKTTWVLCELLYHLQYTDHFRALYWCNNVENQLSSRMNELEEMIGANLWLHNLHHGKPDNKNNVPAGMKEKNFPGNGSTLYGTAVGAGSEGDHVNMVLGDDPLKELGDIPDEKIVDFYQKVIVPMADASDLSAIVGTRKRPRDIYHIIRDLTEELDAFDMEGYRLLEYPAVREVWESKYGDRMDTLASTDPDSRHAYRECHAPDLAAALGIDGDTVNVLWPEGRGPEFLLGKLARQGKAAFVREFCMVFTHVEDAIIKRSWVDDRPVSIDAPTPDTRDEAEAFLAEYTNTGGFEFDRVAVGLDPAVVEGGDNCAWAVAGVHDDVFYHLDTTYINGIQAERMRETTATLYDRYAADVIVAEKNGLEWYMDRHVQFPARLPIRKHTTSQRKHSWQRGVPAIADAVERGLWRFFRDSETTEDLIDGLCSLRMDDNDHLAGHTPDVVMALYMATKGLGSGTGGVVDLGGSDAPDEYVERAAETEAALRDTELGDAILGINERRRERR